jgi:hypothetical protein
MNWAGMVAIVTGCVLAIAKALVWSEETSRLRSSGMQWLG